MVVLAVAGGGGGLGRVDVPTDFNYTKQMEMECLEENCAVLSGDYRPGIFDMSKLTRTETRFPIIADI